MSFPRPVPLASASAHSRESADLIARWARLSPDKRAYLRAQLKARAVRDVPVLPRDDRAAPVPLSFSQHRLWFLHQLAPGSAAYNMHMALPLPVALDVAVLECSLREIVKRHESFRTTFALNGGRPCQIVHEAIDIPLSVIDLRDQPAPRREEQALRLATEQAVTPFDLGSGPLLRHAVVCLDDEEFVLLLTMHHIISDGWSLQVFVRELSALYDAFLNDDPSPLSPLPVQYADFALWQHEWYDGEPLERQLAYWRRTLDGAAQLDLPTDRPRPDVLDYTGATCSFELSADLVRGLEPLIAREEATPFMIAFAAFAALLSRYSGQHDIVVGCPSANRPRPELEQLIGFFVNNLVFRVDLSGDPSFREIVQRVKRVALDAYAHQDVPFEKLVEALHPPRDTSRNPLFQVSFQLFTLADAPAQPTSHEGSFQVQRGSAVFDLAMNLYLQGERILGVVEYSAELFEPATIERLVAHYTTLFASAVRESDRRLSELPLMTVAERHQVLVTWNDTIADYPSDVRMNELVEQAAGRWPARTAIVDAGERLSYAALDARAQALATVLLEAGAAPGAAIAICLERSARAIVAQLACWKSGCAFLPLDPAAPDDRLQFQIADGGVDLVLTEGRFAARLEGPKHTVLRLDRPERPATRSRPRPYERDDAELAYVIYTSGSTGMPKGVEIAHRGLMNLVAWHNRAYAVTSEDRATWLSSPAFDASIWEVWPVLAAGGSVHIAPDATRDMPSTLIAWMAAEGVTISFVPTPLAELVLQQRFPPDLRLRALLTGGDRLRRAPRGPLPFRFYNNYGPTENTVVTTWTEVVSSDVGVAPAVPLIGRPISNQRLYVLDDSGQLQPIGIAGELYIGGPGVARGYRGRPDLTRERFVSSPFVAGDRLYRTGDVVRYRPDGNLEFIGRRDRQVKVRGYRIELGEIEAVLARHPALQEAVAHLWSDEGQPGMLVVYAVAKPEHVVDAASVKAFLGRSLPSYMLPASIVFLDALPLGPGGKVTRDALPPPDRHRLASPDTVLPRDRDEEHLAAIWTELLPVRGFGIFDSFFDLGGHSLLAAQLVSRINEQWSIDFPLIRVFQGPSLAELAEAVREQLANPDRRGMTALTARRDPLDTAHLTDEQVDAILQGLLADTGPPHATDA